MDKVAGDRNAATENLDVFAVVTVEPIFGPPVQISKQSNLYDGTSNA
jgi:hypothetical protein